MSAETVAAAREELARGYLRTGDYDAVERLLDRALGEAREEGDRRAEAGALALQGLRLHFQAIEKPPEERAAIDPAPEQALFERALAIRRNEDDAEGVAESLFHLCLVHQVLRRDPTTGGAYARDALEALEPLPGADPWLRSEIVRHVGFDHLLRGEHDEALDFLERSLALRETLDERGWRAGALTALAMAARHADRRDEAAAYARRAVAVAREEGLQQLHLERAETELRAALEPAA